MAIIINGDGHNSDITLKIIHEGGGSFRKDGDTVHEQVKLLQEVLTAQGYNTQGADGIFGANTQTAVKQFQSANGLTSDGYFGKNSLLKLEELTGCHLDTVLNCSETLTSTTGGGLLEGTVSPFTDTVENISGKTYKSMTAANRINSLSEALKRIAKYQGTNSSVSVQTYLDNLEADAKIASCTYEDKDCAKYTYDARGKEGYVGATTEFNKHCVYFGHIADLGGYAKLLPGMELYSAYRKDSDSNLFYCKHIGVYYGLYDFGDGMEPAVYHSTQYYKDTSLKYETKKDGPNLTSMDDRWTYWGWSKYVTLN